MKKRRFADGGETDPDLEAANASDDPIAAMNKAKRWTDTADAPAKPKVVTKEELEKSGLSLRDYMNKQQGLTRRSTPYTGTGGSGGGRGPTAAELAQMREPSGEPTPSAGNSASGSELGRNIKNTMSALSGYQGVNLAKAAAEGATARAAAARAASARAEAAKKAEMAGELRRGAQPTKFTSPSKSTAAKRTRKFNEDEANTEFKRGGSVQKYANGGAVKAKGWGMARGCRAAKIV